MDGRWIGAVDWSYVGHNLLMVYLKNDAVWGQYHQPWNPKPSTHAREQSHTQRKATRRKSKIVFRG